MVDLVPVRRSALLAAGLAATLAVAVAGCTQKITTVGVVNACGYPIQADAAEGKPLDAFHWTKVGPDEHKGLRQVTDKATEFFIWTRTGEGGPVTEFSVPRADTSAPPEGNNYKHEVVIEGDRCPARQ